MKDTSWLSEIIQKQTEEFLAKGGKIQVFPPQSFSNKSVALRDETFARYASKKKSHEMSETKAKEQALDIRAWIGFN
jgi:hypothetical protein